MLWCAVLWKKFVLCYAPCLMLWLYMRILEIVVEHEKYQASFGIFHNSHDVFSYYYFVSFRFRLVSCFIFTICYCCCCYCLCVVQPQRSSSLRLNWNVHVNCHKWTKSIEFNAIYLVFSRPTWHIYYMDFIDLMSIVESCLFIVNKFIIYPEMLRNNGTKLLPQRQVYLHHGKWEIRSISTS